MEPVNRIELNPKVCNGRPVVKGTRIPVSVILEQIAEVQSWDVLLEDYPELTSIEPRRPLGQKRTTKHALPFLDDRN
jgi:uncharacterized protein (DUF433 family)